MDKLWLSFLSPLKGLFFHILLVLIIDRLIKSTHFLPIKVIFTLDRLAKLYVNGIISRHGVPILVVSDRDP